MPISHEELDREIFNLFDLEGQGSISLMDFDYIIRGYGWSHAIVNDIYLKIHQDPASDNILTYNEFEIISAEMKGIM